MRVIADEGAGMILYEHQEGRGIGLMEKLRAYELQDQGLDTIEANFDWGTQSICAIMHFRCRFFGSSMCARCG